MLTCLPYRFCLLTTVLVLSCGVGDRRVEAQTAKLPNVVVIFCDDLGYGDLGCFGHPSLATPNLDRMASEGQKWTNFYVAASVCTPSRAGLQTGRFPIRSGMCSNKRRVLFPDSSGGLPQSELTIAEILKQNGYITHAIGKWHLGHLPQYLPTSHGYDSYFGIPYSNDMDLTEAAPQGKAKFEPPKIEYFDVPLMRNTEIFERPADQRTITRRYTDEAINLMKAAGDKPFFVYLAHNLPHVPLFASDNFLTTSDRGLYGDVVEEIDWSTGQILNFLREQNLAENTLVVFTSDNGPWLTQGLQAGSAGILRDGKGSTWEGGMREPTIFWWPEHIEPAMIADVGSTLDLLPTVATIAGAKLPEDLKLDGYDITRTLFRREQCPRNDMVYYHGDEVFAIRLGLYKAHFKSKTEYANQQVVSHDPPLLFHLGTDPAEQIDIAKDHPEVLAHMLRFKGEHEASIVRVDDQLVGRIE